MRKKSDLPVKTCVACGRPMVWRKAWAKVWDEVKHCSDACRKKKGGLSAPQTVWPRPDRPLEDI